MAFFKASLVSRMALATILFSVAAGCAKSSSILVTEEGVGVAASGVTLEGYRARKELIDVPPGNRNPQLSWATLYAMMPGEEPVADRHDDDLSLSSIAKKLVGGKSTKKNFAEWKDDPAALRAELDRRYTKMLKSYLKDKDMKADLIAAGKAQGVDPIHILSCMLGENIFNVGGFDDIGTYRLKLKLISEKWTTRFASNDIDLAELVKRPEFDVCSGPLRQGGLHADYWDCVGAVWSKKFAGKTVDGVKYPYNGFKWTFFNPLGTGYSYGPGQLDPIRALMVADFVHKDSGRRMITIENPRDIYEDIVDPHAVIHFVAANIRLMILRYRQIAGFDISNNTGVLASLYNLGGEGGRAGALYKKNLESLKSGVLIMPMENYYGFYMNEKEATTRRVFDAWKF